MAVSDNGVIGNKGALPWEYPLEKKFFREVIREHIMIMGYETYKVMPPALINGQNFFVLSRRCQSVREKHGQVGSWGDCLAYLDRYEPQMCVMIGGGKVSRFLIDQGALDGFILTEIHGQYPGDSFFDLNTIASWKREVIATYPEYTITYRTPLGRTAYSLPSKIYHLATSERNEIVQ